MIAKTVLLGICSIVIMLNYSCKSDFDNDITQLNALIGKAEKLNGDDDIKKWENINNEFEKINDHFQSHRNKYSESEITKFNKLQGKYIAVILKSGINQLENSIKDLQETVNGAIDEFSNSSDLKTDQKDTE